MTLSINGKTYEAGELIAYVKELEEKISILLSCKNCPENKGGYICQKEYEDKCLTQKIQYIKELREENAELRKEWQEQVQKATDEGYARTLQTIQLSKAKELLNEFLDFESSCMERGIYISDKTRAEAEQIFNMLNEISPLKITSKQVPFILAMIQQTFQDGAEFGYNKAKEELKGKCKTAYIKGIRTMANVLKDYDRTEGAWTDYFEHKVDEVLKRLLKESE